jgi:hypothetical protein
MLVTDEPIESFDGKNELVLDGEVLEMSEILEQTKRIKPNIKFGDAVDVLTSLESFNGKTI